MHTFSFHVEGITIRKEIDDTVEYQATVCMYRGESPRLSWTDSFGIGGTVHWDGKMVTFSDDDEDDLLYELKPHLGIFSPVFLPDIKEYLLHELEYILTKA
jgi:hypothetical protein